MVAFRLMKLNIFFTFAGMVCFLLSSFANPTASILRHEGGYKISPGDVLEIRVLNEPECTLSTEVSEKGTIRVVYLGETKVSGLTIPELEETLRKKYLENEIFAKAVIIARIATYKQKFVFLSGSFTKPGPFALPSGAKAMNIVELINMSGGFSPIANKKKVMVTRNFFGANGEIIESKIYEVNVDALSSGKTMIKGQKWWVYPGDQLNVKERLF